MSHSQKWSREETILALFLYWTKPYSKLSKNDKDVLEVARLIGRTPDAVRFKMGNLAHHDPDLIARKRVALQNGSKLDKEIFDEFYENKGELSFQAYTILSQLKKTDIDALIDGFGSALPEGINVERVTKIRSGQAFFRMAVMNAYDNKCCVTGLSNSEMLVASHIKPWRVDSAKERTNPCNGLCLNSFHDKAFDRGFITLNKDNKIVISKHFSEFEMDKETRDWFFSYENKQILLPERFLPGKKFIEYHRDVVFQG